MGVATSRRLRSAGRVLVGLLVIELTGAAAVGVGLVLALWLWS